MFLLFRNNWIWELCFAEHRLHLPALVLPEESDLHEVLDWMPTLQCHGMHEMPFQLLFPDQIRRLFVLPSKLRGVQLDRLLDCHSRLLHLQQFSSRVPNRMQKLRYFQLLPMQYWILPWHRYFKTSLLSLHAILWDLLRHLLSIMPSLVHQRHRNLVLSALRLILLNLRSTQSVQDMHHLHHWSFLRCRCLKWVLSLSQWVHWLHHEGPTAPMFRLQCRVLPACFKQYLPVLQFRLQYLYWNQVHQMQLRILS